MKKEMTNDMTVGSPAKLIIQFMIPMCLGNVFQQFYIRGRGGPPEHSGHPRCGESGGGLQPLSRKYKRPSSG